MESAALAEPTGDSPQRRITDWLVARLPSAKAVRSLEPRLAYPLAQIAQAFAGPSRAVVDYFNGIAGTSPQPPKLHPIEEMPVDLFQDMMWEILKTRLSPTNTEYYYALTKLRLVCRRWTGVLERMPRIWSYISLNMGSRLIGLALSRSGHSPLIITGELFPSPGLDKLLQHTHRWGVLDVFVVSIQTMECLTSRWVPLLGELTLHPPGFCPQAILFNGSAPMLRAVCIRDYGFQWRSSLLSNLHELAISDIISGAPDMDTFLELLSHSPKLTRLHVKKTLHADEHSSLFQTRVISLPCLQSFKLEHVETKALKQVLGALDVPTSAECSFVFAPDRDNEPDFVSKRLKPINQRLATLAEASRGSKSTLTLGGAANMWGRSVRTTYDGEGDQHGPLIIDVERFSGNKIDIYEYFARQLGQLEPNPVPPVLHIVNCSDGAYVCNMSELLQRLHEHLPDTDELLIEDTSLGFIEDAFGALFRSDHSSQLFPKLSTLIIRNSEHEQWAYCLERRQQKQANWDGVDPWPIKTLKVECGTISAEMVETVEKLVQNLVPIVLILNDQTAPR